MNMALRHHDRHPASTHASAPGAREPGLSPAVVSPRVCSKTSFSAVRVLCSPPALPPVPGVGFPRPLEPVCPTWCVAHATMGNHWPPDQVLRLFLLPVYLVSSHTVSVPRQLQTSPESHSGADTPAGVKVCVRNVTNALKCQRLPTTTALCGAAQAHAVPLSSVNKILLDDCPF